MSKPVVLSLVARGTPEFPRYLIGNQFGQVWTGEGWSPDEDEGLLYGNNGEAAKEVQRLLLTDYADKPVRRFRAPIYLDLFAEAAVSEHDLKAWLVRVARLLMDTPVHGNGPIEDTLGLCRVAWDELEELKEGEQ